VTTLVSAIGELVTNDPTNPDGDGTQLGIIRDAAVAIEDGRLAWVGRRSHAQPTDEAVDLNGRAVIPGFVDSHTHLMFAGDRASEFAARMAGTPYEAGGIATTVAATRQADDGALRANMRRLWSEMLTSGTTTVEVKSGYGLTVDDEARSLVIARELTTDTTYLGAHVVPVEYRDRRDEYLDLVCGQMLQACAPHSRWIDVFCDRGAFDLDETEAVLDAGATAGLTPRLHAHQLSATGAIQLGVARDAASVDHCNHLSDDDVDALATSDTVATVLPGADFSTRSRHADARRLLDAGATVAIATDCNPGTSYTTSMPFCVAVAVRDMRLTPAEALWSATAGGAKALRRDDVGVLRVGARADFAVLDAPSHVHLAYRPGVAIVAHTWKDGTPILASSEDRCARPPDHR
jgi:imidazolonepropionase